jgi:hypothetical protein
MPGTTYLGKGIFQGYWNAETNVGSGSGHPGTVPPAYINGLFASGSQPSSGYHSATGITASVGNYWIVTGTAANYVGHDVEGQTVWRLNDWVLYSGSVGGSGTWVKIATEDLYTTFVLGDLNSTQLWNMTGSAHKHVLYTSGTIDGRVHQTGSSDLIYDYETSRTVAKHLIGDAVAGALSNSRNILGDNRVYGDYNCIMWGPITIPENKSITVDPGGNLKIKDFSDV